MRGRIDGLAPGLEEGRFDPTEIVVDRNDDTDNRDGEQAVQAGLEGRDEDEEFTHEPNERRNTRE